MEVLLAEEGRVQILEWSNVEWPIFRNVKIMNINIAKDELFDYFIYLFIFYYFFLNFQIFLIVEFRKLYNFLNKKINS